MASGQTARLVNIAELAAPFQLSRPTVRDYVALLERAFLVDFLPAWHENRLKRLVKSPKLHLGDTGVAATLLATDAAALAEDRMLLGQLCETFVVQELRRQAAARDEGLRFSHLRDKDGVEVDLVIERGARSIAGVEVKVASPVTTSDFSGLRKLAAVTGDRFAAGVVFYDGEQLLPFGERLFAVPFPVLWRSGVSAGRRGRA